MFPWQHLTMFLLLNIQLYAAQRCDEFTDLSFSHALIGTSLKVRLLLYTRENYTCGRLLSHTNLSAHPQFSSSRITTFVIHGYRPTGSPPNWLPDIIKFLLDRKDMNLIIVDWNHGATNVNYFKAVENTHKTADNLTAFIQKMKENGFSLDFTHLIGVSLGAHISGFVGANLNSSIGRITALDPAGPLFTGSEPKDRLDPTDAQFVDVLHTDMDFLGFRQPLGHIDFYANGGADQPNCPKTIVSGQAYFKCDHQRSVFLYLDSVKEVCESRAFPCSSYTDFMNGNCLNCDHFGDAGCPVFGYNVIHWKDALKTFNQKKFYFTTNTGSPFCRTTYKLDVMIWNKEVRWGYITVKLHSKEKEAVATIDHTETQFKRFTATKLFAQFNNNVHSVTKMSLKYTTGNVFKPKYKLRILRIRLSPLESTERPLCRYDILLQENKEVTFRPIPCEDANF